MDYTEADDLLFAIVDERGSPMFATVAQTAFPQTYRAMFGFCRTFSSSETQYPSRCMYAR